MKGQSLSNSPNWYSSHICDTVAGGLVCFAAQKNVFFLDVTNLTEPTFVNTIKTETRVTCVSFNPHKKYIKDQFSSSDVSVAIGSENGQLIIMKISQTCVEINRHDSHKGNKLTCVSWSPADENLIATADDKGLINVFDMESSNSNKSLVFRGFVQALQCCPHQKDLVAVGYKGGSILVVSFRDAPPKILYRLRGHDDDIHSIQWSPSMSSDQDLHLASGSKDKMIIVWNVKNEISEVKFKLPTSSNSYNNRDDDAGSRIKHWLSLYWPKQKPSSIFLGGMSGDVIVWNVEDGMTSAKNKWQVLRSDTPHTRPVFSINGCAIDEEKFVMVTTSLDRQIILWDVNRYRSIAVVPTIAGFVYCLSISPLDNCRLAIGCGDQMLRIWNLGSRQKSFDVVTFWQGIKAKITCVAWHPEKEGLVAFGTEEGRVGIYNVLANKNPQISSSYHKNTVYNVCWGPECSTTHDEDTKVKIISLYSCGDGIILQHSPTKLVNDQAVNIDTQIIYSNVVTKIPSRSDLCWKPDWTVVAIGNVDGSIEIRNSGDLILLCQIYIHKKLIQCLRWHPMYTVTSGDRLSSHHCWLASSSNEEFISICDLTDIVQSKGEDCVTVTTSTRQLIGHTFRIPCLAWSPHKDATLVSVSYDSTAQVWDVDKAEPIANFQGHSGRLFCCIWNPLDPDEIITGGDDLTVQRWKISEQTSTSPPKFVSQKVKKKRKHSEKSMNRYKGFISNSAEIIREMVDTEQNDSVSTDRQNKDEDIDSCTSQQPTSCRDNIDNSTEVNSVITTIVDDDDLPEGETASEILNKDVAENMSKKKKRKNFKSYFPLCSVHDSQKKGQNQKDCLSLLEKLYNYNNVASDDDDVDDIETVGMYLDQRRFLETMNKEMDHHVANDNIDFKLQLEIWKGNISGALYYAAHHKRLNDWLVSIAPQSSRTLWLEMCKLYAEQLLANGDVHKAVLYLLARHEVHRAIDVLKTHSFYREAVALAKARLPPSSPLIDKLMIDWAMYATRTGQYEQAAKCYLAANRPLEAANVISKRADENSERVAAHIAVVAGDKALKEVYYRRCIESSLLNDNWENALKISRELNENIDEVLISTHHWLYERLESISVENSLGESCEENFKNVRKQVRKSSANEDQIRSSVLKFVDSCVAVTTKRLVYKLAVRLTLASIAVDGNKEWILKCAEDCFAAKQFELLMKILILCDGDSYDRYCDNSNDFTETDKSLGCYWALALLETDQSSIDADDGHRALRFVKFILNEKRIKSTNGTQLERIVDVESDKSNEKVGDQTKCTTDEESSSDNKSNYGVESVEISDAKETIDDRDKVDDDLEALDVKTCHEMSNGINSLEIAVGKESIIELKDGIDSYCRMSDNSETHRGLVVGEENCPEDFDDRLEGIGDEADFGLSRQSNIEELTEITEPDWLTCLETLMLRLIGYISTSIWNRQRYVDELKKVIDWIDRFSIVDQRIENLIQKSTLIFESYI